jgi:nucleoside-diphosphate kinase
MTLAIIKPDGMLYEDQIMEIIQENGFKVLQDKTIMKLSDETISEWYFDKHEESYYPSLMEYLQRGPVRVLSLSRMNAIPTLRTLIGPTNPNLARQLFPKSIRAFYGTNIQENSIHASDSKASAEREYKLFF